MGANVDAILLDFLERIGILLIGVVFAAISTTIVTMAIENGEYAKLSKRRIVGIRLFGGLAGLVAGLGILVSSKTTTPQELVFALWLAQVAAGMGGGDAWRRLDGFLKPQQPMAQPPPGAGETGK